MPFWLRIRVQWPKKHRKTWVWYADQETLFFLWACVIFQMIQHNPNRLIHKHARERERLFWPACDLWLGVKFYIIYKKLLKPNATKQNITRLDKYCVSIQKRFCYLPLSLPSINVNTLNNLQTTYRTCFIENLILNIFQYLYFCRRTSHFQNIIEKPARCHYKGEKGMKLTS